MNVEITLWVDGLERRLTIDMRTSLLDAMRERLTRNDCQGSHGSYVSGVCLTWSSTSRDSPPAHQSTHQEAVARSIAAASTGLWTTWASYWFTPARLSSRSSLYWLSVD